MFQYPASTLSDRKSISQETHILPFFDHNSAYTLPFIFLLHLLFLLLWHHDLFSDHGLHGSGVLRLLSCYKVTMAASCPALNLESQFISLCLAPHSKSFQPVWPTSSLAAAAGIASSYCMSMSFPLENTDPETFGGPILTAFIVVLDCRISIRNWSCES